MRWTFTGSAIITLHDAQHISSADFTELRNLSSQMMFKTGQGTDAGANGAANISGRAMDFEDPGTQPTCDVNKRGWVWMEEGGAGVADTLSMCLKDAADVYAWVTIISGD